MYLDLSKEYDSLDHNRFKHMLKKNKVRTNPLNHTQRVWDNQHFTLRDVKFYSEGISVERGVIKGDVNSTLPLTQLLMKCLELGRRL